MGVDEYPPVRKVAREDDQEVAPWQCGRLVVKALDH